MRALRKEEEERDLDQLEWNRQREDEEARWGQTFDAKDRVRLVCAGSPLISITDNTACHRKSRPRSRTSPRSAPCSSRARPTCRSSRTR